jgi:hypothetical protein
MAKAKPKEHQKPSYPTKRNSQPAVAEQRKTSWWTSAKPEGFSALAELQTVGKPVDVKAKKGRDDDCSHVFGVNRCHLTKDHSGKHRNGEYTWSASE